MAQKSQINNPAIALLNGLLNKAEIDKERTRDVLVTMSRVEGYPYTDSQALANFHEELKLASDIGAIRLEWKKHYGGHELERVRVIAVDKLAEFLGRSLLSDQTHKAMSEVMAMNMPSWLRDTLGEMEKCWRSGKSWHRIKVYESEKIETLIKAVDAIENMPEDTILDYRQFGARYLGNSKQLKTITSAIAAIYRGHLELKGVRDTDILTSLNLVKLAHPVFIRGPLTVSAGQTSLSADYQPYIGIPLELAHNPIFINEPEYLLTIENLSSFNEYTQNIRDSGIIIYTAGYPNRAAQRFYRDIAQQMDASIYHWGDTDPHGFRILSTLQKQIPEKTVIPHLMMPEDGKAHSETQINELKSLTPINPIVDKNIYKLIGSKNGLTEQERISARPPK